MSSSSSLPSTYKAAAVVSAGKFELVTRNMPEVAAHQVLIKTEACGCCHSDCFTVLGHYPGLSFPRVPGHEVIGTVVKCGSAAKRFKVGQRVGRGWYGQRCDDCENCRAGDFIGCLGGKVTGIHDDGGYAEYMLAPEYSLAFVPDGMDPVAAASLMCAGVTVFNGLRQLRVLPPSIVVVQGIGGLGHLAIQYARKMGYHTIAVSRGADKKKLALDLGAHLYLDSESADTIPEIKKLGGAAVVLTTTGGKAASPFAKCLAYGGTILAIGADPEPFQLSSLDLIPLCTSVHGHASGTNVDSEHTLKFAKLFDVKAQTEVFAFADYQKAYDRMMTGKALFRVVLKF